MNYANNVTELIGNTPLVRINYFSEYANIFGKCEFLNPSHSVKDRIALNMIKTALQNKTIDKDTVIIEPTSGNTGVGLALVCASFGLKLILTMPSSMSIERRKLLGALGAELILTDASLGMKGAVNEAQALSEKTPNSYVPQQFANSSNPQIHRETTALEILEALDNKVDIFVAGVGTGGTITGVGEVLKAKNPNAKIVAVEPDLSPVLSGGNPGAHKIQGIGAGFIPEVMNVSLCDEILKISFEDAVETSRALAKKEGLLVGISAGANVYASKLLSKKEENRGKNIVTILCDTGERYLSTTLYE